MMLFQIQPANDGTGAVLVRVARGGGRCVGSLRRSSVPCLPPPLQHRQPQSTAGVLGLPGANRSEFECNVSLHSFPLGPGKVSVLMAQVWIDT